MRTITIRNMEEEFPSVCQMLDETFSKRKIAHVVREETMLMFEALYATIQKELAGTDTELTIAVKNGMGVLRITAAYRGRMHNPLLEAEEYSPETRILQAYGEKLDYSYRYGYNTYCIALRKNIMRTHFAFGVAGALAVAVYALLSLFMDAEMKPALLQGIVIPTEKLFANAMLLIAAPVTFFSLLKNRTNAFFVAEWNPNVRRLHWYATVSSIGAVLLATLAGLVLEHTILRDKDVLRQYSGMDLHAILGDSIDDLFPSSIFAPFEALSPFPLIILSALITYAMFSAVKHFDLIKQLVDALYELLSRILYIIMATLPFFLFAAILDVMLRRGIVIILYYFVFLLIMLCSILLLMFFYGIRLKCQGIAPIPFARKMRDLVRENYLINSAIDAVPYNVRWCARNLGMDRKQLWESMPIMAQINLDGNCFIIMLSSLLYIFFTGAELSALDVTCLAILVLFLSMGAPNQPGSCLIGIMVIFYSFHAYTLLPLALITEALFGSLQNLLNVAGDIVTLAENDARQKRKAAKEAAAAEDDTGRM